MKKLKETYGKITASEEVKARIAENALNQAVQAEKEQKTGFETASGRQKTAGRRRVVFSRIMAGAVCCLLVLVIALQPWAPKGTYDNTIIDKGGNPAGGTVGGGTADPSFMDMSPMAMSPVTLDRGELVGLLAERGGSGSGSWTGDGDDIAEGDAPASPPEPGGNNGNKDDYAKTNVQHEGVDEGDIIKVDGGYIYSLSQEGLVIVGIAGEMKVSCKIKFDNFYPDEMFISGDRLIIIGGYYSRYYYRESTGDGWADADMAPWNGYRSSTRVMVYNLNDRVKVTKLCEYDITGYFITSRLIGNRLIWAVSHTINRWEESSLLPKINGEEMSAQNIYLYKSGTESYSYYSSFTVIASLNLDSLRANATAHLGLYGVSYFSKDNVYFFSNEYIYDETSEYSYRYHYSTVIVKINLGSLMYAASARLDGHVYDRYWADEYQTNLRVVTHYYASQGYSWGGSTWMRHTNVFVLDKDLNTMGTITDIASGENIHSVRFHGDEGSIVTYLQVDPLFKLDVSDPENPAISKGLKEEGVNDHLQYLSDDVILGLGRGSGLVGMKVALYDNTGADAVNMKTVDIGKGNISSEALWNPKAILNDTARQMFSFAATDYGAYNYYNGYLLYSQGLHVFGYNLDAANSNDKLVYRGILSNITPNKTYSSWYDYYDDYFSYVKRGARIGDKIYTVSERYICSYDISSLKLIQKLQISDIHCHRMEGAKTITPATCDTNGSVINRCTHKGCGHTETGVLYALGCNYGSWSLTVPPTQTASGIETRVCTRDKRHTETRKVTAEGLVISPVNDGKEYIVSGSNKSAATVVIPAAVDGLPVTGIGANAFNNSAVRNISFASGSRIKSIGDNAFAYAYNLSAITIPYGVTRIGNSAFFSCTGLNSIVIPGSVTEIGSSAFYSCISLGGVAIPDGVTEIGSYTFYNCSGLKNVNLPGSVIRIGNSAFYNCPKLSGIVLPEGVTYIGGGAFSGCTGLKSIDLPDGITEIGSALFYNCTSLGGVIIPDGVTYIGYNAFQNCTSLTGLVIPEGVTYIGGGAFSGCTGIKEIVIPDGVTSIDANTFYNCMGLTAISLPDGITAINDYAFYNCFKLTGITIPDGVKYIGNYAFYNCTGINEIAIPDGVAQICYGVFSGWNANQSISIKGLSQKPMGWFMDWNVSCDANIIWDA